MGSKPVTPEEFFASPLGAELLGDIDKELIPCHVAIIMDGNGRWASERNKPRIAGHKAGALAVRETIAASIELGVEFLTLYSFSSENWTRPQDEVNGLMMLFVEVLTRELTNLNKQNVRVRVIGDMNPLPNRTRAAFNNCVDSTAGNSGLTLIIALNYGARQDLVSAVQSIARQVQAGALSVEDIDATQISTNLSTVGIPDPDLLIRTSGELRISNFLLWEIAYAELYVTPVFWPAFDRYDYLRAVIEFQKRNRRFGGL